MVSPGKHWGHFNYRRNLVVKLTDNANGYVIPDAIRLERVGDLPANRVTSYSYDLLDNLTQVTENDPDGVGPLTAPVTQYVYDYASRLYSMTDPAGRQTLYEYDPLGRRTKVTEPDPDGAGPLPRPLSTFTYDLAGT